MRQNFDLTQGSIVGSLTKLALPIMATSFVQMAYNMTNMVWLGHLSSSAVAAVGTAGFFPWFGACIMMLAKVGAEVTVAQAMGRKDDERAALCAVSALQIACVLSFFYAVFTFIFARELVSFLGLQDGAVTDDAVRYLRIVTSGLIFINMNPVFSGIYNGAGNSRVPFAVSAVGLGFNMVLDPILIYGYGGVPALGVTGAAIATLSSQVIVSGIFVVLLSGRATPIRNFNFLSRPSLPDLRRILKIGTPVGMHSALFTFYAILIARVIAHWGTVPIAVQKVGAQIEAISWMTASGFASALSAFVGQNLGAQKYSRIFNGFFVALAIMGTIGLGATLLLTHYAGPVFALFMPQADAMPCGTRYLQILGLSQLFMCIEITTSGAFNGMGRSLPPSLLGIVFNGLRVPGAMILSSTALLGLDGVWWSVSMSSVTKGVLLLGWFLLILFRHPLFQPSVTSLFERSFVVKILRQVRSPDRA